MKLATFFTGLIFAFALSSFSGQPESISVRIDKKGLFVNKSAITGTWQLTLFETGLGYTRRSTDAIYIYDDLGIKLFKRQKDGQFTGDVSELQLYYAAAPDEANRPQHAYTGNLTVDKLKVIKNSKPDEIRSKLKTWNTQDSYIEHAYRYDNGSIYIFFIYNETEDQLTQVSIGPVRK